jgi:nucleotide-binding universal stress UspA family protein
MEKILVPCDFSEQAIHAFRLAIDIANTSRAEVHVLHVIELPIMHDDVLTPLPSFDENLLKELGERAEIKLAELKKESKQELFVTTIIEFGPIVSTITNYQEANNIALIVMGTKGISGIEEVFIGSTAEKVVRHASCPVAVVKRRTAVSELRHIVFPNSLEKGQEDLVMHVKALQDVLKATLHIVWIDTSDKSDDHTLIKQQLEDFAKRFMLKDYTINVFKANDRETGIINFTHWINASMIAMGTHARKGLSHFFKGSVTEDVVNHVDCPIWTYVIKGNQ